jgi:formylglycine-generating enzyme required for sulfatase activity
VRFIHLLSATFAAALGFAAAGACTSFDGAESAQGDGGGNAADGSVGDGGAGADGASDATTPGEGGSLTCPSGRGAPMVRVADFCIDQRETTFGDYRVFMLAGAAVAATTVPAECAYKKEFAPAFWPRPSSDDPLPAQDVDWCDAWAYCAWAGKRLCGGTDGAKLSFATPTDPRDEWYRACTNELTTQFSYGPQYDVTRCNVSGHFDSGLAPGAPGSFPACRGTSAPYDAITDLVGNVGEWQRSCNDDAGTSAESTLCRVRGGNWYDNAKQGCVDNDALSRNARMSKTGIRCCADPR